MYIYYILGMSHSLRFLSVNGTEVTEVYLDEMMQRMNTIQNSLFLFLNHTHSVISRRFFLSCVVS